MAAVVAIDAGTTSVRALAFDVDGSVRHVSQRPLSQHFPRPGWVEHDPDEIWTGICEALRHVCTLSADEHTEVAAVGITNQRETAVAWDRRTGRPLGPAIVWQDKRTATRCAQLAAGGATEDVRRMTGLVLDPYFSATKFDWMLRQGGIDPSPDLALGTVDSWLVWQLTGGADGGLHATDPSNASRTLLYDIDARCWSEELCALFDVPITALAEVRPTCGRFGTVARGAVPGAPLLDGVGVSAVVGDQQAALFGQACVEPGMAKVTYGTGSFVLSYAGTTRPPTAPGLLTTVAWDLGDRAPGPGPGPGPGPVAYAIEGSTFVAGAAIQWLRDGLKLITAADEVGPLAESVPDSGGLVAVPAFAGLGSPWWDPNARGIIVGITRGTGRGHVARAVVEAMAYSVRDMVDAMTGATGTPCPQLRADGGAAVMSLLLQLQADQLQLPVVRPVCTEATALGAALLAGLAEGVWGSVAETAALWQPDEECRPRVDRETAGSGYARWLTAVERARAWVTGGG